MKNPYLIPSLFLLAGIAGFMFFNSEGANRISQLLSAIGVAGLLFVAFRRK